MFWADKIADEIIQSKKYTPYWVDDMKTASGRIHVGALMGVVIHDSVARALREKGQKATFTYVFENHDPMDDIPSYLSRETYEQYLGMPLFKIPAPVEGYENFAAYYAEDFQKTFNAIGSYPEIIWTKDLYTSGKMNKGIKTVLDNAQPIRDIYQELYKKELAKDWYPFQVYCEQCGKVSTTRVYKWDGELVYFRCPVDAVKWTKGCGYEGKTSPFSDAKGMKGKMPWKVEWPTKWQAIGVTVEGAGKDHMSKGGSHDLASLVAERVLKYPVPYAIPYEWLLIGGRKMSSSKGVGTAASDMLQILPPELIRFLIVRMDIRKQSNFDPSEPETIPSLFDAYQKAADAYFEKTDADLARVFELSQVGDIKKPPTVRFSVLAQWLQMPNMLEEIKKQGLEEWAKYAKFWLENYAPEAEKFFVQKALPESAKNLTEQQKAYLQKIAVEIDKDWTAETFQKEMYEWTKVLEIAPKLAFAAIYQTLLGKDHGPKAAWLILSLDKKFVKERFTQVAGLKKEIKNAVQTKHTKLNRPEIFSIAKEVSQQFPSISVGIAIIKDVTIEKTNPKLENEKQKLLATLEHLTTEELGRYPEILNYRKLYKAMGVDWHSRRPSPEALLRRVALKKGLYTINTAVDSYNLTVMRHRVSVGAFDLDQIVFPTMLKFAKETDEILLLGDSEPTHYKKGELAYFDKEGGYNIDFNFRDSQRTAVSLETKNLYLNVDGIDSISPEIVETVLREACDNIIKYCGGKIELFGVEIAATK